MIMNTVLRTVFVDGTDFDTSDLIKIYSADTYIYWLMANIFVAQRRKKLDFSIGFWEHEGYPFLVGETGYSDGENLIMNRVRLWIQNADGRVDPSDCLNHI
jgi:hypothetical protein